MTDTQAAAGESDAVSSLLRPHLTERGELALDLDGTIMTLRPSYEAIIAFEQVTGKPLIQLAREALRDGLSLGELAGIACECIRAWGRDTDDKSMAGANAKRVGSLIQESKGGVYQASVTIGALLSMASTGGYTAQGKPKAVTTMTTEKTPVAA